MVIFLVRHGQTELNKAGLINGHIQDQLTLKGEKQAKYTSEFLPKSIKRIYSSSLNRAKQTAEILNKSLNVPITFHDELKEVNFGILNGTIFLDEYKRKHKMLDYDWRPSGENLEDFKKRILEFLKKIKINNQSEEILIVGHGGIIRLLHFLEFGETLNDVANASMHRFELNKIIK